jgi:RimJ/RimL family protein N-acetyltransferase
MPNNPADSSGTAISIPTIHAERILLRAFESDDLEPYAAMNADPETMAHLGGPIDKVATWRLIASLLGHWHLRGFGMWAAEDRATGEFLGRAGLYEQHGWPGIEVAGSLKRARWGSGLAIEAGEAVLDFAATVVKAPEVISVIRPENAASIKAAERLGLTYDRNEIVGDVEQLIYRTEPGWADGRSQRVAT